MSSDRPAYTITIEGPPIPKGSVRGGSRGYHLPKRTREHMERCTLLMLARRMASKWQTAEGPVCLEVMFVHKRPARLKRKDSPAERIPMSVRPDMDNLLKAIKDSLTKSGVWKDDCQVTTLIANKVYAAKGEQPCTEITVRGTA